MDWQQQGVSAFPVTFSDNGCDLGMSMRQYYAAAAMQGMLASGLAEHKDAEHIANLAFICADAMLAESEKK